MLQMGWTYCVPFVMPKPETKWWHLLKNSMCIITVIWIYMYQVYAFCCTGETDWKVLAIDVTDPLASDLNGTLFILGLIMFLKNYTYCCMYQLLEHQCICLKTFSKFCALEKVLISIFRYRRCWKAYARISQGKSNITCIRKTPLSWFTGMSPLKLSACSYLWTSSNEMNVWSLLNIQV